MTMPAVFLAVLWQESFLENDRVAEDCVLKKGLSDLF